MPSKRKKLNTSKRKKSTTKSSRRKSSKTTMSRRSHLRSKSIHHHLAFWPLLLLVFLLWILYRQLFNFPVWFDETLGKAIFFALPVWAYVNITNVKEISNTFAFSKMKPGLLLGLAIGGIYGFVASILGLLTNGGDIQPVLLFTADQFWWEFLLAILTSFWETLFFFSFVMVVINQKFKNKELIWRVLITALIFTFFHLPNAILRFNGAAIFYQFVLMFLFGIGQSLLFYSYENAYSLVLSQTLWGMVLLVHF